MHSTTSFSMNGKEGRGDTSVWTDSPLDRAQKAQQKYGSTVDCFFLSVIRYQSIIFCTRKTVVFSHDISVCHNGSFCLLQLLRGL